MATLISTLKNGKKEFFSLLSKRMNERGDFPALFKSVQLLEESIQDKDRNASEITDAILKDFTLAGKVLNLANSAAYSGTGREITTITHAAAILGTDNISNLTLTIRFVDTLTANMPDSEIAHKELEKAILAGEIVRNIMAKLNIINGEQAVVCALMHHLGRLLLAFNFPDQWAKIQQLTNGQMSAENNAALEVIGLSIDEISQVIAKDWGLPSKIANSMKSISSQKKPTALGSTDWMIDIANFSAEAAAKIVNNDADDMDEFVSGYNTRLKIPVKDIAMSIDLAAKTAEEHADQPISARTTGKPIDAQEKLASGIQEVSNLFDHDMDLDSAIRVVLETMYASMGFNRAVAFLRDSGEFRATAGFGSMMPEVLPQLVFSAYYKADVFHVSLAKKADIFIHEMATIKDASSIPTWFKNALPDVGAFILLPLVLNGRAVGLLYADWETGVADLVEPDELSSMGVLRDQLLAVMTQKYH